MQKLNKAKTKKRLLENMGRIDNSFKRKVNLLEYVTKQTLNERNWVAQMDIHDLMQNYEQTEDINSFRDGIMKKIEEFATELEQKGVFAENSYEIDQLYSIFDEFSSVGDEEDADYALEMLYDWGDENSVFINGLGDMNEGEEFSVEPQEHGEEGPNYKAKLEKIVQHAENIYEGLPEGELPSWVQDKITIADDYLDAICGWMHGEEEEKEGETKQFERIRQEQ